MKVLEKTEGKKVEVSKATYNPSLDNLPVPQVVMEKVERATEFLKKHPVPEHVLRRK
jgi:hypothetical protein